MGVEIYDRVGGEKLERLIARHVDVQQELAVRASRGYKTAQVELEKSKSRKGGEYAREHRQTHPFKSQVYSAKADIDHHVGIQGYVASHGGANHTVYRILMRALRRF